VWSDAYSTLQFSTENKVISNGQVTADNIPADGKVWQCRVIDLVTNVIVGDVRPTVSLGVLDLGTLDYDGKELEFTYAYGSISSQLQVLFDTFQQELDALPTYISSFTNDSGYQTSADVNSAIQAIVGAAPAALDTLAEIAAQLENDQDAVSALTAVVSGKANSSDIGIYSDFTSSFNLAIV
jgi:hypothetical protein